MNDNIPYCHICRKPVDRIERRNNVINGGLTFKAFCHGKSQTVYLTPLVLMTMSTFDLIDAFIPEQGLIE